jgi:hypothetical protein
MNDIPDWRDDSRVGGELRRLKTRQGEIRRAAERLLHEARGQGRDELNLGEAKRLAEMQRDLADIDELVAEGEMEYRRMGQRPPVPYDAEGTAMTSHDNFDLTYRRGANQPSWLRDLITVQVGSDATGEARGPADEPLSRRGHPRRIPGVPRPVPG